MNGEWGMNDFFVGWLWEDEIEKWDEYGDGNEGDAFGGGSFFMGILRKREVIWRRRLTDVGRKDIIEQKFSIWCWRAVWHRF